KEYSLTQSEAQTYSTKSSTSFNSQVTDIVGNSMDAGSQMTTQFSAIGVPGPSYNVGASYSQSSSSSLGMQVTYGQSHTSSAVVTTSASASLSDSTNPISTTIWLDSRWDTMMFQVPTPSVTGVSPASGSAAGGGTLDISGKGFWSGPVGVQFCPTGGGACTDASASTAKTDDLMYVTPPPLPAGTYDVQVFSQAGPSAVSAADVYTALSAPPPTVTGVSPQSGPSGSGTPVTITGTGFLSGPTGVEFCEGSVCTPAQNVTVISDTEIEATSPALGVGTADIVVTGAGGQSLATSSDQFTFLAAAPQVTGVSPGSGGWTLRPARGTRVPPR
ncbi:Cell surface receptor IPT/TIG domain protein, partial [mine drainage metagenome]